MSLFASRSVEGIFPPRKPGQSDGELRKQLTERGAPRDSAIITKTELDAIRSMISGAYGTSFTEKRTVRTHTSEAEERKRRMMEFDEERRNKGDVHKSGEELEREKERQLDLERAKLQLDEQYDEVKAMNRIILEAKCIATREVQRLERAKSKEEEKEYDRKIDAIMTAEDKRAQQIYLERERCRMEEQRRNGETIKEQLREREVRRIRQLERNQQEQEAMTRHIELLHQEEHAEKIRRQDAARYLMEEAAIANAEQLALKAKQREMTLEEDRKMAEYIKQREVREQAHAEEQQRIRDEKEKEIARLRANQERAQNKQEEIDELRAQRVQAAYLLEQRRKEREAKEREVAMQADLQRAREEQMVERKRIKEEETRLAKEELDRIYSVQTIAKEQELQRQARQRQLQEENSLALLKQMMEVEERRRRERLEEIEEGYQQQREMRERAAALEAIRQRKLEELESLGAPAQYRDAIMKIAKK